MRRKIAIALGLTLILSATVAWFFAGEGLAMGMLVMAPSPRFAPRPPPSDVADVVDVERAGARVRSWVFEPAGEPKGTVLLLHGIRDSKASLLDSARAHTRRGLRAVAVDSRGHGESSGRFLTYGVEESRDLRALVDALEARGRLTAPLAVAGSSYGAATALLFAARDPRVRTVVASAPFASMREVVAAYLRFFAGALGALIPQPFIDARIDRVAKRAGFDPDLACPRCVAPRIDSAVLLIHSRDDERIPYGHSLAIYDALKCRKRLMLVDGVGHVSTNLAPGVSEAIERWLDGEAHAAR